MREEGLVAQQEAQRQLDAAMDQKKRLEFQRSQLNRRSQLYAIRAAGIDMQIAQAEAEISAAQSMLDGAVSSAAEPPSNPEDERDA